MLSYYTVRAEVADRDNNDPEFSDNTDEDLTENGECPRRRARWKGDRHL